MLSVFTIKTPTEIVNDALIDYSEALRLWKKGEVTDDYLSQMKERFNYVSTMYKAVEG